MLELKMLELNIEIENLEDLKISMLGLKFWDRKFGIENLRFKGILKQSGETVR